MTDNKKNDLDIVEGADVDGECGFDSIDLERVDNPESIEDPDWLFAARAQAGGARLIFATPVTGHLFSDDGATSGRAYVVALSWGPENNATVEEVVWFVVRTEDGNFDITSIPNSRAAFSIVRDLMEAFFDHHDEKVSDTEVWN